MTIFGENNFLPLPKFGKEIPNYAINDKGDVIHTGKQKIRKPVKRVDGYYQVCVSVPVNLFDDYEYFMSEDSRNTRTLNIHVHKAVAEAHKPIDKNPPKQLADTWNDVPEEWRQWVRETDQVDHVDDDKTNNHVSNLEYRSPRSNNIHRKEKELGYTRDIHAHRRVDKYI